MSGALRGFAGAAIGPAAGGMGETAGRVNAGGVLPPNSPSRHLRRCIVRNSRRNRDLVVPQKALLYDADLVRIIAVSPAQYIHGRQGFDLGFEPMVCHKIKLNTAAENASGGSRRNATQIFSADLRF